MSEELRGVCIWLTGRGGSGKSTLATSLVRSIEGRGLMVTVLDVVPELRKLPCERSSRGKLIRKAYVAKQVVRHGGIAVCVTISSRTEIRQTAREMIGSDSFIEVLVDAPPEIAENRKAARNRPVPLNKRLTRMVLGVARRLGIARGRGYEEPTNPDVIVDSASSGVEEGVQRIVTVLEQRGFLPRPALP